MSHENLSQPKHQQQQKSNNQIIYQSSNIPTNSLSSNSQQSSANHDRGKAFYLIRKKTIFIELNSSLRINHY